MVVSDFVAYEFLQVNMRAFKPYAALGVLSFTALVLWVGTYGFQVLLWGRRVFGIRRSKRRRRSAAKARQAKKNRSSSS